MVRIPLCSKVVEAPVFAGLHYLCNGPCVVPHFTLKNTATELGGTPGRVYRVDERVGCVIRDVNGGGLAIMKLL